MAIETMHTYMTTDNDIHANSMVAFYADDLYRFDT